MADCTPYFSEFIYFSWLTSSVMGASFTGSSILQRLFSYSFLALVLDVWLEIVIIFLEMESRIIMLNYN